MACARDRVHISCSHLPRLQVGACSSVNLCPALQQTARYAPALAAGGRGRTGGGALQRRHRLQESPAGAAGEPGRGRGRALWPRRDTHRLQVWRVNKLPPMYDEIHKQMSAGTAADCVLCLVWSASALLRQHASRLSCLFRNTQARHARAVQTRPQRRARGGGRAPARAS